MKVYSARQAVFDRRRKVVAYELLFRDGPDNFFPAIDPNQATPKLLVQNQLNHGLSEITRGKRALINFTEQNLLDGLPRMLSPEQVVIEIIEDTSANDAVYASCEALYHRGYKLALDDFSFDASWKRFYKFVSLIKIDIQKTPLESLGPWFEEVKQRKHIKLLAERVETHQQLNQAMEMGFNFFQGYFFCKPEMQTHNDLEAVHVTVSYLVTEASREIINVNRITAYFERDTGLSYKLLRFVNSGHLPAVEDIRSIKQAIVYIGNTQLKKLVFLLASALSVGHKPKELIRLSVHRARFCELVAATACPELKEAAFITGLFSLLDAILDKPLSILLSTLPLDKVITDALLDQGERSPLSNMLATIRCYEQGKWFETERYARQLRMDYPRVEAINQQALAWSEEFQSNLL